MQMEHTMHRIFVEPSLHQTGLLDPVRGCLSDTCPCDYDVKTQDWICSSATHRDLQVPWTCEGWLGTRDFRFVQHPQWMWLGLHWSEFWSIETRERQHHRHIHLGQLDKLAEAKARFNHEHEMQIHDTKFLSFKSWHMDHIVRTTQETKLRSNNSNM